MVFKLGNCIKFLEHEDGDPLNPILIVDADVTAIAAFAFEFIEIISVDHRFLLFIRYYNITYSDKMQAVFGKKERVFGCEFTKIK